MPDLHASGDLERRVRDYWKSVGITATIDEIFVKGDGFIRVQCHDTEGSRPYHISLKLLYASTKDQT